MPSCWFSCGTAHMMNTLPISYIVSVLYQKHTSTVHKPSDGSSVGSHAGCQFRGCQFEPRSSNTISDKLRQWDKRHSSFTNGQNADIAERKLIAYTLSHIQQTFVLLVLFQRKVKLLNAVDNIMVKDTKYSTLAKYVCCICVKRV